MFLPKRNKILYFGILFLSFLHCSHLIKARHVALVSKVIIIWEIVLVCIGRGSYTHVELRKRDAHTKPGIQIFDISLQFTCFQFVFSSTETGSVWSVPFGRIEKWILKENITSELDVEENHEQT